MTEERDFRLTQARCRWCQRRVDAAMKLNGGNDPEAGDYTVCLYCAGIAIYRRDGDVLALDRVSDEAFVELPAEFRSTINLPGR